MVLGKSRCLTTYASQQWLVNFGLALYLPRQIFMLSRQISPSWVLMFHFRCTFDPFQLFRCDMFGQADLLMDGRVPGHKRYITGRHSPLFVPLTFEARA